MTGYGICIVTGSVYGDTRENSLDGSYKQRCCGNYVVLPSLIWVST